MEINFKDLTKKQQEEIKKVLSSVGHRLENATFYKESKNIVAECKRTGFRYNVLTLGE